MTDIEKLAFNLQEKQYPLFTNDELALLLEMHGDLWTASYYGCIMKAQRNDEMELDGIKLVSNADYWITLANTYKNKPKSDSTATGYKVSLGRVDGQ